MQPVQFRKFSKYPLLLFAFGLIVSLAGCAQPPPPQAKVVAAEPELDELLAEYKKKMNKYKKEKREYDTHTEQVGMRFS